MSWIGVLNDVAQSNATRCVREGGRYHAVHKRILNPFVPKKWTQWITVMLLMLKPISESQVMLIKEVLEKDRVGEP